MTIKRLLIAFIALLVGAACGAVLLAGSFLTSPATQAIGNLPPDLNGRPVEFQSNSGATIHGWFLPGQPGKGGVILMHGVRANRLSMVARARFLSRAGCAVLLFDFQAHGESTGKHITFGSLESKDAQAAVNFLRENAPGNKIAVIGVSLGGAATILASPPLQVDAVVLEMVYPTIEEAISDRLAIKLGRMGRVFTPLLALQLRPRLGIRPNELRPIDKLDKSQRLSSSSPVRTISTLPLRNRSGCSKTQANQKSSGQFREQPMLTFIRKHRLNTNTESWSSLKGT